MLKNHISVALRNLVKHKFFSVLNILGLSIGLTCFMLVLLYTFHEMSFESFRKDTNRIYRINVETNYNGDRSSSSNVGVGTAAALKNDFPEVEDVVRLLTTDNWLIKAENNPETYKLTEVLLADSNVFEFFSIPLVYGKPDKSLTTPYSIAIDHTTSKKIFGDRNPVGEVVILDNMDSYRVDAVYEDMPLKSHFHSNMIIAASRYKWTSNNYWLNMRAHTYLKLKEGSLPTALEAKFPEMVRKYCASTVKKFFYQTMDEFEQSGSFIKYSLISLHDIYLKSNRDDEVGKTGNLKYIYFFLAIAVFILILACVNFMNLATARATIRAKEVGVRKTLGAYRSQLINQFMAESVIMAILSFILAIPLAALTLLYFNVIFDISLSFKDMLAPRFVFSILGVALSVGILAGLYPAFYLSLFRPIDVLKGGLLKGAKRTGVINGLVVLQFSISIIMMIGTLVVFDQLSYIQNRKLGYEKDQTFMVYDTWCLKGKLEMFETAILKNPSVRSMSYTRFLPVEGTYRSSRYYFKDPTRADEVVSFQKAEVGYDFFNTMGLKFLDGRPFDKTMASDSSALVINETAAKIMGYENPVGDKLYHLTSSKGSDAVIKTFNIIGVVEDFHFNSFKEEITPLLFEIYQTDIPKYALFNASAKNLDEAVTHVKSVWQQVIPGQPFEHTFISNEFDQMYAYEQQTSKILFMFVNLAIFIACLGLFGLSTFIASQKVKEIGIRKILGASETGIVLLLSKSFTKLVVVSCLIGLPVAYFIMDRWLQDFVYRTKLKPTLFLLAGVLSLLIAAATIGIQALRASRIDPAKSLKEE